MLIFKFHAMILTTKPNKVKWVLLLKLICKLPLREICVFGYDIVIHRTPFVVVSSGSIYYKINMLWFAWRIENPCVPGSIPDLATI